MRKSVDKKTGITTFHWKSDKSKTRAENIQSEIDKSRKSIEDLSRYLDWYKWNFERAEKDYKGRLEKIEDLKNFISLLEETLFSETYSVEKDINKETSIIEVSNYCRMRMKFRDLVKKYNIDLKHSKFVYRNKHNFDSGVVTIEFSGKYVDFEIEEDGGK